MRAARHSWADLNPEQRLERRFRIFTDPGIPFASLEAEAAYWRGPPVSGTPSLLEEQFRTFYWPSLRTMCLGLIEYGLVPYLFAEGSYDSRLEIIRDLPPGRTVWHFDQTDMRRAKETPDGIACIQGNVLLSLLRLGDAQEVEAVIKVAKMYGVH